MTRAVLYLLILFVGGSALGLLAQAYPAVVLVIVVAACLLVGGMYQPPATRSSPRTTTRGAAYKPPRPTVPQAVRQSVFDRDGRRCVRCGAAHDLEIDHIIPLSKGGSNTANNLQVLCAACNRSKGNRHVG